MTVPVVPGAPPAAGPARRPSRARALIACLALACLVILGASPREAGAQSPFLAPGPVDLYFLSVGAGNHVDPDFPPLHAPARSAEMVARSLMRTGARHGILLTSAPGDAALITRQDFYGALTRLKQRIRADRPQRPRVMVYVQMHGIGDAANGYLFMIPDNLEVRENPLTQDLVFPLAHRAILNLDILGGLAWLRMDDRFRFLDSYLISDQFPERLGIGPVLKLALRQLALSQKMDEVGKTFAENPPDNTPIPFMVLLDNCSAGVLHTIDRPDESFNAMAKDSYRAILEMGTAAFAVEPGRTASTWALPKDLADAADKVPNARGDLVPPVLGPLAIHLRNVLARRSSGAMSLADLFLALQASGDGPADSRLPPPPFMLETKIYPQIALADFLPPAAPHPAGRLERVAPTGRRVITCCSD